MWVDTCVNGVRDTACTPWHGLHMPSPFVAVNSSIRARNCDSEACGVASKAQIVLFWFTQVAVDLLVQS